MKFKPRIEPSVIGAVLLAGIALRLLLWSTQAIVSVDGTAYIRMAQSLAGGPGLGSVHPWGYPILIFVVKLVSGDWVLAARVVDFLAGVALIPLTWLVARKYVERWWLRILPALAVALLPLTVRYSLTTMSEAPYLALLLVMFLLYAHDRAFLAGLAGGLAYLVRPEALTAVAILAILSSRKPRRAAIILAGACVLVLPYVVGQGLMTGTWTISQKTVNVGASEWWENEPRPGEPPPTTQGLGERVQEFGSQSVSAYPGRLRALGEQLVRHGGWLVPVVALGGIFGPAGVLAAGLVQFLVTPVFAVGAHARFAMPFIPLLWILAVAGLDRLRNAPAQIALAAMCVAGLAGTAVVESRWYTLPEDGDFPELVEAGEWLGSYVGPRTVVYDRKPYTAFYAGATYRALPIGGYDEILDAVVAEGGDFLVVDQGVVDFFRPSLLPLVTDKAVAWNESRLRPVYLNNKYKDRMTLIYRVVRPGGPDELPIERGMKKELSALDHQPAHFFHGILAMRAENWQTAAGEFNSAIMADSSLTVAFNNRAWCLVKAGRALRNAESNARMAVSREPDNLDYLDTFLQVMIARGKTHEADSIRVRMEELESGQEGSGSGGD